MNCIQERNPFAGFRRSHSRFCLYCEEEATLHFNVGHACGNICEKCARKKFQPQQVEAGIYVEDNHARISS